MVYRWRCRQCPFVAWAPGRETAARVVKTHLMTHHGNRVRGDSVGTSWSCPYCNATGAGHDYDRSLSEYRDHLFGHVEPLLESGVHVADEVERTGSVLVHAPLESTGADNTRIHFHSPADIVVIVTTNPRRRLELVRDELGSWPAWTVVLTTKDRPFAGLEGIEDAPVESLQLNRGLGLAQLGQAVSRVLGDHEGAEGKISVEFDILGEILDTFSLEDVFKFLTVFTARCADADALSHYYFDPRSESASTVNVIDEVFDLKLSANENVFTIRQ